MLIEARSFLVSYFDIAAGIFAYISSLPIYVLNEVHMGIIHLRLECLTKMSL